MCAAPDHAAVVGLYIVDLFRDDAEAVRMALQTARKESRDSKDRYTIRTRFGAALDCDVEVHFDAESGAMEVFMTDASEQTAMYQSLMQTEKLSALGEIVAGVAHELNNPLTGVMGYAQLLLTSDIRGKSRFRLEQIMSEALRCKKIVEGLLGFSRHQESHKAIQDLNAALMSVVTLREYQLRVDGIELNLELDDDLPMAQFDAHNMERVFLNIINNAHHALRQSDEGKRSLTIRTVARNGEVSCAFEDTGPGIPKKTQGRIFEPFFTTKKVGEGTGLGLSLSFGIMKDHEGRIEVESTEGSGTTMTIYLPAIDKSDRSS